VKDVDLNITYSFVLQEERSVLFATDAIGQLLAVYRPEEVKIIVAEGSV
jgi:hypothetical protein